MTRTPGKLAAWELRGGSPELRPVPGGGSEGVGRAAWGRGASTLLPVGLVAVPVRGRARGRGAAAGHGRPSAPRRHQRSSERVRMGLYCSAGLEPRQVEVMGGQGPWGRWWGG